MLLLLLRAFCPLSHLPSPPTLPPISLHVTDHPPPSDRYPRERPRRLPRREAPPPPASLGRPRPRFLCRSGPEACVFACTAGMPGRSAVTRHDAHAYKQTYSKYVCTAVYPVVPSRERSRCIGSRVAHIKLCICPPCEDFQDHGVAGPRPAAPSQFDAARVQRALRSQYQYSSELLSSRHHGIVSGARGRERHPGNVGSSADTKRDH